MKNSFRVFALIPAVIASSALVHAHPGHDGHELTWDFGHLAAHPLATSACVALLLAVGGGGWFLFHTLRRSHPSRGK
jgi:hypothetical protein